MRRFVVTLLAAILGAAMLPDSMATARNRPRLGVFGTIHGKRFRATSRDGVGDSCVYGIYDPDPGSVVFVALECRARRRRQGATRRNYKTLVMACSKFGSSVNTSVFPYELPCPGSGYQEARTVRYGLPISMTQWGANSDNSASPLVTSKVRIRVDAFDGVNVRGAIFGVFDVPVSGAGSATPAEISGEVGFNFPFEVR